MATSPIELPGKVLIRGPALPNSKDFAEVINQLLESWQV